MITRKVLVLRMIDEGVRITAISEALAISRVRVYEIKRGYTKRQRMYRNHFVNGHSFQEDCEFCLKEKQEL